MNKLIRFVVITVTAALLFAGCSGILPAVNSNENADSPEMESNTNASAQQELVGLIELMDGDRWIVAGSTVFVNPAVRGGVNYSAGDRISVEGTVNNDGSITAIRLMLLELGNANTNEGNINTNTSNLNSNTNANANTNTNTNTDTNSNSNTNDD